MFFLIYSSFSVCVRCKYSFAYTPYMYIHRLNYYFLIIQFLKEFSLNQLNKMTARAEKLRRAYRAAQRETQTLTSLTTLSYLNFISLVLIWSKVKPLFFVEKDQLAAAAILNLVESKCQSAVDAVVMKKINLSSRFLIKVVVLSKHVQQIMASVYVGDGSKPGVSNIFSQIATSRWPSKNKL